MATSAGGSSADELSTAMTKMVVIVATDLTSQAKVKLAIDDIFGECPKLPEQKYHLMAKFSAWWAHNIYVRASAGKDSKSAKQKWLRDTLKKFQSAAPESKQVFLLGAFKRMAITSDTFYPPPNY
jgi:exonuclease III